MFDQYNTDGYTQEQIDDLNAELEARLDGLEPESDEYKQTEKAFQDEVSRR